MPLAAYFQPARAAARGTVVWLHGFLGDHREWQTVAAVCVEHNHLFIDLPGHGGSAHLCAVDFAHVNEQLIATLNSYNILEYWLVGYSLGGRIAMFHAAQGNTPGLRGLVVEGGHPGLLNADERDARCVADKKWAQRFRDEPIESVLDAWYRQPVFATLTDAQRRELITLRACNAPTALATMLEATSPGRQPPLYEPLARLSVPFHYLCGERDAKFRALAATLNVPLHVITGAGHNAHRENPAAVARCLNAILRP
ncbi:2-succinyl-6-hydroxy-2,4-cyclohexadiene-1-carboxylate synthase [Cronobacter sakazakii]|uniref:2-succinyl-6-hydroxy-2,4-cyclohexadiene-1-carboxylate synthase n=1 Tax=Cronobacter sakazakii TaxID=28141 RepID=A0AAN5X3W3_CROSK|nr:2-succinyl-6-hydroxy-2,4-cyclohexadiene-1-carboxylate synthase [Cronobacter sakazakii]EGT4275885.1 2-succinyl-6-hydroxy-2,4-cyclohexadiene-1-carboxylate synthase [Cronobacter sakazakii]EGT5694905.1 2-succinyl-6-hydroxy-2,4-cyclohexadiene-1-carboxylate synthase [Cronobacter sakazakii]EGT5702886.1 2-succinyl-6-hydroxy-2,4-cyclohexadiene-1-carboxylate synthase [Cronobacter sakazakii]EGT5719984.1 2-succinyl-6-hydroxy-2,4-cyclohexadiene-1-carboxylate synthase [Cronobacter sakazakii]EGT5723121.1 